MIRFSLRLSLVFEGRLRQDRQALRARMFGVRRGPRRRLSLRLPMVSGTGSNLEASCKKARSPGLTPTHVWRLERLKRASSAVDMLIFQWIYKRFVNTWRKR